MVVALFAAAAGESALDAMVVADLAEALVIFEACKSEAGPLLGLIDRMANELLLLEAADDESSWPRPLSNS